MPAGNNPRPWRSAEEAGHGYCIAKENGRREQVNQYEQTNPFGNFRPRPHSHDQ